MMNHTVKENWNEVEDRLRNLFPQLYKYRMTPELANLWRKRLGTYATDTVLGALDDYVAEKRYFPTLTEILARCRARTASRSSGAIQRRQEEEAERATLKLHWAAVDQVLAKYDLDKEKQALLELDERHRWAEDVDATSRWWKGPIYVHLKKTGRPPSQS
jgi:hypothetical protein